MAVYVDSGALPFGRMKMCHMMADSLEELHAMADRLGLKREWFQHKSSPHYDLSQTKRQEALALGAIPMDRAKTVELIRFWRTRQI